MVESQFDNVCDYARANPRYDVEDVPRYDMCQIKACQFTINYPIYGIAPDVDGKVMDMLELMLEIGVSCKTVAIYH